MPSQKPKSHRYRFDKVTRPEKGERRHPGIRGRFRLLADDESMYEVLKLAPVKGYVQNHLGYIGGRRGRYVMLTLTDGLKYRREGEFRTREEAAEELRKFNNRRNRTPRRKYYTVKRSRYGDDVYSWRVVRKSDGCTIMDGESRQQAGYYATMFENEQRKKRGEAKYEG